MAGNRTGWRSWFRDRPLLFDSLLALALFTVTNVAVVAAPYLRGPVNLGEQLAWSAAGLATIVIRRRWLWLAAILLSVHTAAGAAVGVNSESAAILVLTYTAAAYLAFRRSAVLLAVVWLPGLAVAVWLHRYDVPPANIGLAAFLLFNALSALVAFLAGRIAYTRRRYVAALEERARSAEQNQQALATQAVQDERRRIARELHDMVAHHVSVMGVLATGSRRVLRKDPDTADEALATIEKTSRTALREMRRLLDVLRTEPEPVDPLAPQPGLAGLAGLVEQVREAGLTVTLHTPGGMTAAALEPGVALTVYRIVQEALTNVIKHGGPLALAEVRLEFDRHWLTLEVYDTGLGPAAVLGRADGVGHGLLGMRERVALFGGTLRTGPRPGGGFRVYARIPLDESGQL
jgi:signal transduction histidine kinase